MSVRILRAGLQTTIQAEPRTGMRHLGVPQSGPADALSMALANHLVDNPLLAPALETTLTGVDLQFETECWFAITGAPSSARLNREDIEFCTAYRAEAGDTLRIGSATAGARVYVAVAGGFIGDAVLGSRSTYLTAAFGGHEGRALQDGDQVAKVPVSIAPASKTTPCALQPPISASWALRACDGADISLLDADSRSTLFDTNFTIGNRADRMGLQLEGAKLTASSGGRLPSAPVFPGCIQCPESGTPFLLSVDAQTTGGYPRVAQLIRADRHLLGQLRPGTHMRLVHRTPDEAVADLREKLDYWRSWLPAIETVI